MTKQEMTTKNFVDYRARVDQVCQRRKCNNAIVYMREDNRRTSTSYEEMVKGNANVGRVISEVGIIPGDRVAIVAPHSPQAVLAAMGLAYANVTSVLIDASLPVDEIRRLLDFADVRGVFTTEKLYQGIGMGFNEFIPFIELCNTENEYRVISGSTKVAKKESTQDPEKDVIAILFSSGTTAQMKGIKVTYNSVMKSSDIFIRNVEWKPEYSYLHVFPLNHIAGYATVHAFLSCGCELGMIENMSAAKLQKALLEYEPYGFGMIPRVFEMMEDRIRESIRQRGYVVEKLILLLMGISSFFRKTFGIRIGRKMLAFVTKQVFGRNIVAIGTGASICRPSTSKFFLDLGLQWTNNYASTETNVPAVSTGNFDKYPVGMAGNINRNPEIDVKINVPDEKGVGEIYIKSELLMKGYFRDDELTRQSYCGGYFKTGDYGYIDKKGNLFVTGRIKESILLQNGKKLSPTDVENYYLPMANGMQIACCGYLKDGENYEEVHMFVQTKGEKPELVDEVINSFSEQSKKANNLYRLSAIHRIDSLPLTTVGKVKRYRLQLLLSDGASGEDAFCDVNDCDNDVTERVVQIIKDCCKNQNITLESSIKDDLAMDSLAFFEMCTRIERSIGRNIFEGVYEVDTVADIIRLLNEGHKGSQKYDVKKFPLRKTDKDCKFIKRFKRVSNFLWKFDVQGVENISSVSKLIFCPNHESYLDALWVAAALEKSRLSTEEMSCLAAEHLMEKKLMKRAFTALGGIPIDRTGNPVPAMERALHCLKNEKCYMLIHPEGTRSRNGELGEFKNGAAKLAKDSGVTIIPVSISGAYEIFPPGKRLPKVFDWKHFRKLPLTINFGKPIEPGNLQVEEITEEIRRQIVEMQRN